MSTKLKPVPLRRGWAIMLRGNFYYGSFERTKKEAIRQHESNIGWNWAECVERGFTCQQAVLVLPAYIGHEVYAAYLKGKRAVRKDAQ